MEVGASSLCVNYTLSAWESGSSCLDFGQQKFGGTHGKGFVCCFHAEDKFLDDLFPLPFGETTEGDLPGFTVFTVDQEDGQSIGNVFGSVRLCPLTLQADDILISDSYRILIDAQSARKIAFDGKVGLGKGDRLSEHPDKMDRRGCDQADRNQNGKKDPEKRVIEYRFAAKD